MVAVLKVAGEEYCTWIILSSQNDQFLEEGVLGSNPAKLHLIEMLSTYSTNHQGFSLPVFPKEYYQPKIVSMADKHCRGPAPASAGFPC